MFLTRARLWMMTSMPMMPTLMCDNQRTMWDDDNYNEDENDDPEEGHRRLEALPVYKKALEILDLTEKLVDTFHDGEMGKRYRQLMLDDALVLPAKIAGAEAVNHYIAKMENATVIKIHARSILTQTSSAKHLKLAEPRHLQLLRDEIDAFRLLFKDWVKTFDKGTIKDGDGWGLFANDEE
jgi:hypothetical protein